MCSNEGRRPGDEPETAAETTAAAAVERMLTDPWWQFSLTLAERDQLGREIAAKVYGRAC